MTPTEGQIRQIIREELEAQLVAHNLKPAYTTTQAAEAVGYSKRVIEMEIAASRLIPSYANTKPIILSTELHRWLLSLPDEPIKR
jgi:hypothetical protein